MARRQTSPLVALFGGPGGETAPMVRRICDGVRDAVARGALKPGARLPSARALASDLGVSRSTVEAAFARLDAEGLLARRAGAGTFVSASGGARELGPLAGREARTARASSSSAGLATGPSPPPSPSSPPSPPPLSPRGRALVEGGRDTAPTLGRTFAPCAPGLDAFPFALWGRLLARHARLSAAQLGGQLDLVGLRPLREAIAAHLGTSRGVRCEPDEVLITTSTQQSLDLCARVLLAPGDAVWHEEPGYLGARHALQAANARIAPVPVDAEGLRVDEGRRIAPGARLAYVTPSYQYPLGVTMSARRRAELLGWAREAGAWIFEDDYDSEFRFDGPPLAAIQGLDGGGRVLYAGTFNKIMFPSLRLAYLVAPRGVVEALALARAVSDGPVAALAQAALAEFVAGGHFAHHVRTMRGLFEERRDALLDGVARELPGRLAMRRAETGTHAIGWLPAGADDAEASRRAAARGLEAPPLSRYFLGAAGPPGLVISYAMAAPAEIRRGVRALGACL